MSVERFTQRIPQKTFWRWALWGLVLFYGVLMTLRTLSRGTDFLVFYEVARRFWHGVRPYDIETYGNLVFKYPPWILPAFLPFSFMSPFFAKLTWGVLQAVSLGFVVRKLERDYQVRAPYQIVGLVLFFGVIGLQGMLGQVSLPMLALVLMARPLRSRMRTVLLLGWVLSAKIFSVFPLLYVFRKRKDRLKWFFYSSVLFFTLSLPIYFRSYDRGYAWMKREWIQACFSGVENKSRGLVEFTNREAQGLPSLFFRNFHLNQDSRGVVIWLAVFSFFGVGLFWSWLSKKTDEKTRWLGWLALMPVVQPLGWMHFFIFAYPLSVFTLQNARSSKRIRFQVVVVVMLSCIAVFTEKTLGHSLGGFLEAWSIKSLGVIGLVVLGSRIRNVQG